MVDVQRYPKGQIRLYRHVDRLRAPSPAIAAAIIAERPASKSLVRVVPNAVDTDVFRPSSPGRGATRKRKILYTGRVHPEKGVHMLVQAFRSVHEQRSELLLQITGPTAVADGGGGPPYMHHLQELAEGLPVSITGPVWEPRELAETIRFAEVYCYPSLAERGETFGVAVLEAMATGLAPIVSALECFENLVDHRRNGLVFDHRSPRAVQELAGAILLLLDNVPLAIALGAQARRRAETLGYTHVADTLIADIEALAHT